MIFMYFILKCFRMFHILKIKSFLCLFIPVSFMLYVSLIEMKDVLHDQWLQISLSLS